LNVLPTSRGMANPNSMLFCRGASAKAMNSMMNVTDPGKAESPQPPHFP
jgi:hypothetical protein